MLRTGFEDGCYEHKPRVKSGKDNQWILLKRMLIKGPVPTPYTIRSPFSSADISQAKKGELLIDVNVNFTCLRCTHTPCLSTWLHLRFSYRMKILLFAVSIARKQSASQTQALSCADRYPVAWTVQNLWRILAETQPLRGRRCILLTWVSENSSQELSVPPCPQEIKSSHSNNIIVITALQRDK